jgi:hypothetical protein
MHTRIACLLLIASAVTQAFVCLLIASLVTPFFRSTYALKSWDEAREFMPTITRVASDCFQDSSDLFPAINHCTFSPIHRTPFVLY